MFPKTKPITTGVIYKLPIQTRLLEQIITEFESLDLKDENSILGDFNISLHFRGKHILYKPRNPTKNLQRTLENILN